MNRLLLYNGCLFISKLVFDDCNINANTTKVIFKRKKESLIYKDGRSYIKYESVPDDTLGKLESKTNLLAEYHLCQHETKVKDHLNNLHLAHTQGYIKHLEEFKTEFTTIERKKINAAAKLYAVWLYIIENTGRDSLVTYTAFNKVYPGKYKTYNTFANAKSKAIKNGAKSMAIDQRWFTTPLNIKKISVVNQYWISGIISIGKKYSNRTAWKKLCALCKEGNEKPPSLGWVHKYRKDQLKKNYNLFESRNGKQAASAMQQTFASMQHALHANSQWQMDGWTLPFWVDGYKRYVIVIVRDAYSKKIIGSAVGETENTIVIMSALRKAIINTGCLPYEILTDNHSFNQTKEAANFKDAISKIGTQYTVTCSPTHKSIIERYNKHLDTLCKEYFGYVGEGIKSKGVDARPKQELLDLYGKNAITEAEIKLRGIEIVENFNNDVLPKEQTTPNKLFEESEKPNCFSLSVFDRIKILTAQTECKIIRGQITIKRGLQKNEYQLPASINAQYNNTTVIVRYEDLNDCIYLYDIKTDESMIELKPKLLIHGAKADQTQTDIDLLNKNKGRISGIKSKSKKENEALTAAALKANPEAYELLNKITTPKNILKELEENANLKRVVIDEGINIKTIHIPNRESEMDNVSFMPANKKNDTPFAPNNHSIRKISANDFNEE